MLDSSGYIEEDRGTNEEMIHRFGGRKQDNPEISQKNSYDEPGERCRLMVAQQSNENWNELFRFETNNRSDPQFDEDWSKPTTRRPTTLHCQHIDRYSFKSLYLFLSY